MQVLFALVVLPLAFSARINVHKNVKTTSEAGFTDKPAELCADEAVVRRACAVLGQSATYKTAALNPRLMKSQLESYFMAPAEDVKSLLLAIGVHSTRPWWTRPRWSRVFKGRGKGIFGDDFTCRSLCTKSLQYISSKGLSIPDRHGQFCSARITMSNTTSCVQWDAVGEKVMTEMAHDMDLTYMMSLQNGGNEGGKDEERIDHDLGPDSTEMPASSSDKISYSVQELAVRVAKIFNVYPSNPDLEDERDINLIDGDSLLEKRWNPTGGFGPNVMGSRKPTWITTMEESESWVNSALTKLPGNRAALTAWFGSSSDATYNNVRAGLLGMANTLSLARIKVGVYPTCSSQSSTMAYVMSYSRNGVWSHGEFENDGTNDRKIINVCERYWNSEFIVNPASKFGTIVHEASHHQGTSDESYRGAGPYGRAQCMRMASEAPDKAINNADNFKWLIYFLNYCSDAATSLSSTPPCEISLRNEGGQAKIGAACTKEVSGASLKITDSNGEYQRQAANYGTMGVGRFILDTAPIRAGTKVSLFFESECVIWEAVATWTGATTVVQASKILDLASGGSGGGGGDGDGGGGGAFNMPCTLTFDKSVAAPTGTSGEAGFKVLARCTAVVQNAKLSFGAPTSSSPTFNEISIGTLEANSNWVIFTHSQADLNGYKFTLTVSNSAAQTASTEVTFTADATPNPTPSPTQPPTPSSTSPGGCEIEIYDDQGSMTLSSGGAGFQVKVKCASSVSGGKLKFNGTNYANSSYSDSFAAGTSYTLITLDKSSHMGSTFTFESTYGGVTGTVTSVTVKSGASQPIDWGVLPCELILDDSNGQMQLSSGGAGFKIKVQCSASISSGKLSFPGTSYVATNFGAFSAGGLYTLTTLRKSDWVTKTFQFESEYNGRMCKTTIAALTMSVQAEPELKAQPAPPDATMSEDGAPQDAIVSGLDDGSGRITGNDLPQQGLLAIAIKNNEPTCFACETIDCPTDAVFHSFCAGCPICTGEKPVETCSGFCKYEQKKTQCNPTYVLHEFCSGCSFCTEALAKVEPITDTCGKMWKCNRDDPEKYCNGNLAKYCGGCSWCP